MTVSGRNEARRSAAEHHAAPSTLPGDLSVVAAALHETYDAQVGSQVVDAEIHQVADRFAQARIRSYLPLFVQRYVRAGIRHHQVGLPQPVAGA
jgi:hypothetical protein